MKINQRLFDHYGIDTNKDLNIQSKCPRPFDTVLIDKNGSCYACECQSWLPQSIGNLQVKTLEQIVGGHMHQHLQNSIKDDTYRYCNEHRCSYLKSGNVMHSRPDRLRHLRLAIDESCNLRCPSCRKGMIFHKQGSLYNLGIRLSDKINDWLRNFQHPIRVHIGSDGDPFASQVYRHFMEQTPRKSNIKYSILTNGLMFREFHHRIPHVIDNLLDLGVSIDGASEHTYEKLRLGGKWDKINDNLQFMSELRQKHDFEFIIHFVVQRDNFHEMDKIIDLGVKYKADRVWLNKIEDWGTSNDFHTQNIWSSNSYLLEIDKVLKRIQKRNNDGFIECPTLISEEVLCKNKN